jgi:hypothetical protein
MRFTSALMSLALAASSVEAAFITIRNKCPERLYVLYDNEQYKGAKADILSGEALGIVLSGTGKHSCGSVHVLDSADLSGP